MMNPKRVKISAEVEPSVRMKFRIWSAQQKRSARQALAKLVEDAVAEMGEVAATAPLTVSESPPLVSPTKSVVNPVALALGLGQFNPQNTFLDKISTQGRWLPEAMAEVREMCDELGVAWILKLPRMRWLNAKYRPRCENAGRNFDADIEAVGGVGVITPEET